ncbi:hypothetical protein LNQ03_04415 [Klebsiella pneumoniae subsp. pneumoniae]|nr:hypothetical protein [Klebsiella pneumoniae subsp. pneumoniae]
MVVDLAVNGQRMGLFGVVQRLGPGVDVYNRQALVRQNRFVAGSIRQTSPDRGGASGGKAPAPFYAARLRQF